MCVKTLPNHTSVVFRPGTHENGGPLTTLPDPIKLCPLQSTKWIYEIAFKYPINMDQISWHSEWVDTIMNYEILAALQPSRHSI